MQEFIDNIRNAIISEIQSLIEDIRVAIAAALKKLLALLVPGLKAVTSILDLIKLLVCDGALADLINRFVDIVELILKGDCNSLIATLAVKIADFLCELIELIIKGLLAALTGAALICLINKLSCLKEKLAGSVSDAACNPKNKRGGKSKKSCAKCDEGCKRPKRSGCAKCGKGKPKTCKVNLSGSCFEPGTMVQLGSNELVEIELIETADRVATYTAAERLLIDDAPAEALDSFESDTIYYRIKLLLESEIDAFEDCGELPEALSQENGQPSTTTLVEPRVGMVSEISLLRDRQWLEDHQVEVGGTLYLDMPEMGCVGDAEIDDVEVCTVKLDPGQVVTGTFKHSTGEIYHLKLKGSDELIGVTATHPFWSIDRKAWVAASELEPNEKLSGSNGLLFVESIDNTGMQTAVYNLEVDGDHVYRIGEKNALVHNSSEVPCKCKKRYGGTKTVSFMVGNQQVGGRIGKFATATFDKSCLGGGAEIDDADGNWWEHRVEKGTRGIQLGHILANQLGGEGGTQGRNLQPQFQAANLAQRTCEGLLVKLASECNCCVTVRITVNGFGNNPVAMNWPERKAIPDSTTIRYSADCGCNGTWDDSITIENRPNVNTNPTKCSVGKNLPCRVFKKNWK